MEETQALDYQLGSLPEESRDADELQVGSLKVSLTDGKHETLPLYTGQNFVARRSAQSHRDEDKVQAWKRENPGAALHGIFLESASVSSPHAIIYLEAKGSFCFVKDLGSKNKTLMEGSTGSVVLQTGDRYAVHSGAAVKFGNIGCTIQFSAQPMGTPPAAQAPTQAAPSGLEATQAYDAVETEPAGGDPQDLAGQLQSAQAVVAASEAAPARAPLQMTQYAATQIEMDAPAVQATPASVPAQLLETLQLGQIPAGPPEGAVQGQEEAQQRQIGVSMGFDDGDSVWLPQLTGGPSHQVRVSQQEVMSPPKEDAPVVHSAHPGNTPQPTPLLPDQATLPAYELPQGDMGEPTLAEALNAAEVPRSQHGDSGSLDEPAQPLPGRADRPPVFPASMESMLAEARVDEEGEDPLPVVRARRRSAHVLDDTQPVDELTIAEDPSQRSTDNEAQAAVQLEQAAEPGPALTEVDAQEPAGQVHADTLQQLGLDSPALPDQAGGPSGAEGQDLAMEEEPEQAPPATGPGSGALRPSTQDPDQAAPAWTPLTSPDGWRSKRKARSTEPSPAATPEGLHLRGSRAEEPGKESNPAAVGVEGQVAKVPQQGARRHYAQEEPGQAPELQEGSWRVKHHLQAGHEAPAPSAEQPGLTVPPQVHAAPVEQPSHAATEQQPDVLTAAQEAAAEQQQPRLPPETQGVTSGQMGAALANIGDLASMYPDSQVEPVRQVSAHEAPPVLPEQAPVTDGSPGQPRVTTRAAQGVQQESGEDPILKTGVAAPTGISEAVALGSTSGAETAADEPEAGKECKGTAQAGRAKGKARAAGRAVTAKGRLGSTGTASSPAEADVVQAADAAPAQPGRHPITASVAAAQPENSEYSFRTDTEPGDNPSVRIVRAAATATRRASAATAQKESEGDLPKKATRQGRKAVKAARTEAEITPVSARPKRSNRRTAAAAAAKASAKEDDLDEAPEPDQGVDGVVVQEEGVPADLPTSISAAPVRGKKVSAPAERGKAGKVEQGKEEVRHDDAADRQMQAKYTVSRATRAAQRRGEEPEQADAGPASTAQQAKRGKREASVVEPAMADSSARKFAGLTESQAAADTLAKVKGGRHFSAIQEDHEAPGQGQPLPRQAAPARRTKRSKRAGTAQAQDEETEEAPETKGHIPVKRARRSAQAAMPQETVAAEPENEQQPAAKKGKRVSRAAAPQVTVSKPEQELQPAGREGTRASRVETPQAIPADPKEAGAPPSKRSKLASGSRAAEQAQPHAAKAGKRAVAKPAQLDSEPPVGPEEEPGPSAVGRRHTARLGKPSKPALIPDRQLRAATTRPVVVLISSCIDAKLRKSMTKIIERLGGSLTASPEDFTVFVTLEPAKGQKERGFIKSLNTLSALASGAPIVSEKWVDGSGSSGAFLEARDHLLQDAAAEANFGFNLAHAWEAAQQQLLLDNTAVFLTPGLAAAEADKGEGLRMLIARAGGRWARTVAELDSSGTSQGVILGNEKDAAKEKAWAKKSCKGTFPVIGRSEFVSALLQQCLEPASSAMFIT